MATTEPVPAPAHQLQTWAVQHATRAHNLLVEADQEAANASATVPPRVQHRVALAQAHAHVAEALSGLVLPSVSGTAPPSPGA